MIRHRTEDEVYRYDIFKLVIALILAALLVILAIRGCGGTGLLAPTLVNPAAGTELEAGPVTLTGTATPDSSVRVLANGTEIGTAPVDADGNWSFETDLDAGSYDFTFEAVDGSGEVGATSNAYALTVTEPEIVVADASIMAPEGTLYPGNIELSGTGEPGYTLAIDVEGEEAGTTTVASDGTWTLPVALAAGTSAVAVRTLSADGVMLNEAGPVDIDVVQVVSPTIDPPEGLAAGAVLLTGTAMAGTDALILADGASLGTVPVGADGTWSLNTELDSGDYDLSVRTISPAGDMLIESDLVAVSVAEGDGTAVVDGGDSAETGETASGGLGLGDLQVPQFNLPSLTLPAFGAVSGLLALDGIATPNSDLEILADGEVVGTTTADADGNWSFDLGLDPGVYDLTLRGVAEDGATTEESDPFGLDLGLQLPTFDPAPLSLPSLNASLGELDQPSYKLPAGDFSWSGEAEPNTQVGILVNSEPYDTVDVDEDGNWSTDVNFVSGEYPIKLQLLDADGNVLGESEEVVFDVIDQTFPSVVEQDATAEAGTVTLSGSAEPGAEVEVAIDAMAVGTTTADEDGNWTLETDLEDGSYFVQARALGEDGNVALVSLPRVYQVGDEAGVLITDISGGDFTTEPVTITGSAEPNSEVTLVVDGVPTGTVTADADGTFSYTGFFAGGSHTIAASSDDAETSSSFNVGSFETAATTEEAGNGALRVLFFDPTESAASTSTLEQLGESAAGVPATELILDASWSMTLDLSGDNRLTAEDADSRVAIAKSALDQIVTSSIPEGSPVAMRAFGNVEGNLSCRTDLIVPLAPLDRDAMQGTIGGVVPQFNANTAIANSLAQVGNDLATDRPKIVVLLTDGEETCGGDPAAVIEDLRAQGIDVRVNVIGFAIDDEAIESEFARWAELGGGVYYDTTNFDELVDALGSSLSVQYDVVDSEGEVVAMGVVGGPAVELAPGEYTVVFSGQEDAAYQNVVITPDEQVRLLSN